MTRAAKITRREIFEAALGLIDEEGLESLSMRHLGERLGVKAMSLYNHVKDKEAVLDGVHSLIFESVRLPKPSCRWRQDIEAGVKNLRCSLLAHPKALALFVQRPAITEASIAFVEWGLSTLIPVIPQELDRLYAVRALQHYVIGQSALEAGTVPMERTDLSQLSPQEFPQLTRVYKAVNSHSFDLEFELALSALLNGIENRSPF